MAKRISCKPEVGFIFNGRVVKWERLYVTFWPMHREHRSGEHTATRSTDCGDCLMKFRREVLGHQV